MKVRMLKTMLSWKSYKNLTEGTIIDLPDEDAKLLISYSYAEPAESRGGDISPSPPSSLTLTSPPPTPGRGKGEEAAPQREEEPVAVPAGGEPPSPAKSTPDSRLVQWLEERGFIKAPDGRMVWSRVDQLQDGRVVRLVIDFEKAPGKGARYGYELDMRTGEWRTADDLRNSHPLLLQYKAFRDNLFAPKPAEAEVVKVEEAVKELPASEGQVLLQKVEEKDEQQILQELSGSDFVSDVMSQYFYEFESGGRRIVGLSYKGVKQLALHTGNITLKDLELRETPKGYIAIVKARHEAKNLEVYGVAFQPYEMELRDGRKVPDQFAVQKAVGKAQRNALRALIPETLICEAYKKWLERREAGG
jgi:hypothetical protein